MKTLIRPNRSLPAAFGGVLAALAMLGLGWLLATDPALSASARVTAGGIAGLLGAAFLVTSVALVTPHGGLLLDTDQRRLGLVLTGPSDTWWVPLERVTAVRLSHRDEVEGTSETRRWTATLDIDGAAPVVLAEGTDHAVVEDIARHMAEEVGCEVVDATDAPATLAEGEWTVAVRGGAMQWVLGLFGMALLALGIGLFLRLEANVVLGLFVAPVMALLGGVLLGLTVYKRFGHEELTYRDGRFTHRFALGPLRWGERRLRAERPRWRLRAQGLRGGLLEMVADDGIVSLGAGATTRSRLSITALSELPQRCASAPAAPR